MKGKKKRRTTISGNRYPNLIGYVAKATLDHRLLPLRMDRNYRDTLEQAERERNAKIFQVQKFDQQCKNITSLMKSLEQENIGKCNTELLMELNEKKMVLERKVHRLNAELQECPQENVKARHRTMDRIVGHNANENQYFIESDSTSGEKDEQETGKPKSFMSPKNVEFSDSSSSLDKSESEKPRKRNRWSASLKSQIFVRKSKSHSQPISIDLFSSGQDLLQVLAEELGEDMGAYNVKFGTKKVDQEKTLFEQEIYHGTTVDLNLRLQGGTQKRRKQSKKPKKKKENTMTSEVQTTESPEMWTKQQVANWVSDKCQEFEIVENEVAKLKFQNGKALCRLSKEDWIRRSENYGDLLFDLWQELKQKVEEVKDKEETVDMDEQVNLSQEREENLANCHSSITGSSAGEPDSKNDFRHGMIGNVSTLDDIEVLTPLENFGTDGSSSIPEFGTVIAVRGILENKPRAFKNLGKLLIKEEPQGAASCYTVMKIDIRSSEENKKVRPEIVKRLFEEIQTGFQIGIKGRVEVLEENDSVKSTTQCELLKFKLVIDSDQHSLVYVESKKVTFERQISQPRWFEQLIHSTKFAQFFKIEDRIEKTTETVFCDSTATNEEIIKYVVAFKNSFNGNVLVGVKKNGVITGLDMNANEIANWREDLSKTIGSIVPPSSDGTAFCKTKEEVLERLEKKTFIFVIDLLESNKKIAWIHVPKGEARLYVTKPSDIHAYVRTGAETKRLTDFPELFSRLDSLGSRKIIPISDEELDVAQQYREITGQTSDLQSKYQVLKELPSHENQEQEFKMIFGDDPVKTILDKYLTQYSCGFLNCSGGSIIFGVQEDEISKKGRIVGVVMPSGQRKVLVKKLVETLSNFYPPVNTSQYNLVFHDVTVPSAYVAKYDDNSSKCIIIRGPADEVGNKWPKFAKVNFPNCLCRVIRVQRQMFCIVVERMETDSYDIPKIVKEFAKQKISLESMPRDELQRLLKEELCIIELIVKRSQYPIHMVKPIDTYVFDNNGNLLTFDNQMMMRRFELGYDRTSQFDIKKFLYHVDDFSHSGNSYILIASPFKLSLTENDIYGLVIPKWALVIDFDQHPKQTGHLYQLFNEFINLHQIERNSHIKTPQASELGLNTERGICWLAARGYDDWEKSLSTQEHGSWNMTHRDQLRSLLKTDLVGSIKPNYLNIVVLWDEMHEEIVDSLRVILEDILSINGKRTAVTIVCCTNEARRHITENLVKPLQKSYGEIIIEERVYISPPYVLARYLSSKLPDPYKPENEFQVPHQREYRGKPQKFPRILPKELRKNINGYLKMMYISKTRKLSDKAVARERKKFYSGSEITPSGLRENFGIQRMKMVDLETNFNTLLNDRKSHVSMICIKVERGAGSTTMCLQFLFKQHEEYPCAQLIEIGDGLLSYIKDIYRETKLPLILFVDEEIAHLPEFFDFTKDLVKYRHVNVILLFIEPKEAHSKKESSSQRKTSNNTRMKSASDHSIYGTCPYKEIILRRELKDEEMNELTAHLIEIKKDKQGKLQRLRERARSDVSLRTFVHFGLTAFGEEFSFLQVYVRFRLQKADDIQKTILSYLSLIHVFTNSSLPANALAEFLKKKKINLDTELSNPYLRELLSPARDEQDSRRISFHEVAQEILKQLGSVEPNQYDPDHYWQFIKLKSVELAKNVLSVNASTKSIDRLTRRLFVTSEYESEKFSSLITAMTNEKQKSIARDTLTELVDIFSIHTPFRAHLLAHLAKYYMIEYDDFDKAKPLIEEAVKNQEDDSLLRHIHGDIIRMYVQALKETPGEIDMQAIVTNAIQSSECFALVRRKRPHVSHGYISDAIVRITVMQAAVKDMGGEDKTSFIKYLIQMIDEIKTRSKPRIFLNERYLLSLIPDVHCFFEEGVMDVDHKENWKGQFLKCIGKLENLRQLCDKIKEEKKFFEGDDSKLLHGVSLQILVLNNSLEIETKRLSPLQIEHMVKEIYDPDSSRTITDQQMKFWLRHSRRQKNVPKLEKIKKKVKDWVDNATKKGGISPDADFYNYVINFLIAMKDRRDAEKREIAEKLIKRQQVKKRKIKEDVVLPLEWLHPQVEHHINSIDSLLHHDDLVKERNKKGAPKKQRKQPGRDVIEGFLFEKGITKWEGTVKEIQRDWQGTIVFMGHFDVRFVPQNVQPSMPSTGDTVRFCLSFDRLGLTAWAVVHAPPNNVPKRVLETISSEEESSTESDNENDDNKEFFLDNTIFNSDFSDSREMYWEDYDGQRMQGKVVSTNSQKGFGRLEHPHVKGELFFHAAQLVKPVKSLKGEIRKNMVLEFKVEQLTERTRAADIHVVSEEDRIDPAIVKHCEKKNFSPSINRREKELSTNQNKATDLKRWEEGVVNGLSTGQDYGFITPESKSYGKDVFFHRRSLLNKGQIPHVGDRVQFYVSYTQKGYEANEIRVQNQSVSLQKWEQLIGIQDGFVDSVSDDGGNITSASRPQLGYLPFHNKDVLNGIAQISEGIEVHFEVRKRGGKCIAVKINVIGPLKETQGKNRKQS